MSSQLAKPAPTITTPVPNSTYTSPVKCAGTGIADWTVYLFKVPIDGEDIGSASVGEAGEWTFYAFLEPGTYSVFGQQMANRERSDSTATFSFTVTA
ncbi:hypothetical protein C4K03_0200 [Pseudomonas synxantha]|uniref:Uncharacterized protein n=1 Tax=Pseudomonas synxantha TaxID=47883 RepID=A0A3G7U144_9PSED|nr:hypothetical protein [Pseudomonas synxantha]AZE52388.1 hypothetical protein C4K03_0200 [Pseudomonas synxantha]